MAYNSFVKDVFQTNFTDIAISTDIAIYTESAITTAINTAIVIVILSLALSPWNVSVTITRAINSTAVAIASRWVIPVTITITRAMPIASGTSDLPT